MCVNSVKASRVERANTNTHSLSLSFSRVIGNIASIHVFFFRHGCSIYVNGGERVRVEGSMDSSAGRLRGGFGHQKTRKIKIRDSQGLEFRCQ